MFDALLSFILRKWRGFLLLTNTKTLTTKDIADIYKQRSEIEVFFKFIRKNLNFSQAKQEFKWGKSYIVYDLDQSCFIDCL